MKVCRRSCIPSKGSSAWHFAKLVGGFHSACLRRPGRRTPGEQRKPAEARPSFCGPAEGPRGSLRQGDEGFPNVQRRRRRSSLHCNSPTNFCLFLFSSMRLQTFKIVCRPLKNVCRPLKNVRRPFKNVRRRAFLNVDEFFESPKASRRKK